MFTLDELDAVVPNFDTLAALSASPFPIFFEPPSLDERIVNQYSLHSVMSRVDADLETWLLEHPDCWRRIVVPAALKAEVRDRLDQANVTERVLFPGLDGLSHWLRRQYGSRPLAASELRTGTRSRQRHRAEAR